MAGRAPDQKPGEGAFDDSRKFKAMKLTTAIGMRRMAVAVGSAIAFFALCAIAGGKARINVRNTGTEMVELDNGTILAPGSAAIVEVPAGMAGEILGTPYPALTEGALHAIRVNHPQSATPAAFRNGVAPSAPEPIPPSARPEVEGQEQLFATPISRPESAWQRQGQTSQPVARPALAMPDAETLRPQRHAVPLAGGGVTGHILSKIDTDGIYLKVINAEQFEEEAIARVRALCLVGYRLAYEDDRQAAIKFAARVGEFFRNTGIFSISGCGESIAQGDGPWWKAKSFLMRTPLAGTDLSVKAPTRHLPDTSYIAYANTLNISGLCSLFEETLKRSEPSLYDTIQKAKDHLSEPVHTDDFSELLASFAPGFLFAVASEPTIVLPSSYGGASAEIPGLLLGLRLSSENALAALRTIFTQACEEAGVSPCFETHGDGDLANAVFFDFSQSEAARLFSCPVGFTIAYDRADRMLLASTSRELARRSILCSRGKSGSLEDSKLFRAHSVGLPKEGGLYWFSPEFVPKIIKEVLASDIIGGVSAGEIRESMDVISLFLPVFWKVSRTVRQNDGVLTIANRPSVDSTSVMLIEHYFSVSLMSLAGTIWQILPEDSFADFLMRLFGAWKDAGSPLPFDVDDLGGYIDTDAATTPGILAAMAAPKFSGQGKTARNSATRSRIAGISTAIDTYEIQYGRFPESLEDLTVETDTRAALLDKNNMADAWGNAFQYKKVSKFKYEIRSAGPDGRIGTDDDITN